jgi:hypothetical protein
MRQRVLGTVAAMVVAIPVALTVGVHTAAAESDGATIVSFAQIFRRCDFSNNTHIGPTGFARATAMVHTTGSEVIADVVIVTAEPTTPYDVRLIQVPRSSASSCNAGDPGVIGGVLMTDGGGAGGVSLHAPIASGATGAWLSISRPGEFSQIPAEFYTSDFVVPV